MYVFKDLLYRKTIYLLFFTLGGFLPLAQAQTENLGQNVNSPYEDIGPVITPDGKTIYFTRRGHPENQFGEKVNDEKTEDIWVSSFDEEKQTWSKAENLGKSFNTNTVNGIQSISPDGNTIMIYGAYENGISKGIGFSLRHRTEKGWTPPEEIKIEGLKSMAKGVYMGAFMANSGKIIFLYFSEIPNSENSDLYVSKRKEDGTWSRPQNLGRRINSRNSDASPFLAADDNTLYFASDRPGGKGGFDIYQTKRLDESWLKWSVPSNLGSSVNTEGFEADYTIPASGDYAYMSSAKDSYGFGDLVRVKLSDEAKPDPVALVSGFVLNNETGAPLKANISIYRLSDQLEVAISQSFEGTGGYQTTLPKGENYMIVASKRGFEPDTATLESKDFTGFQEVERSFGLKPNGSYAADGSKTNQLPKLETLLSSMYFDTGKIDVQKKSRVEMDRVLTLLKQNPTLKVWIYGHADTQGSIESNHILGENRAKYVRAYLIANGIASYRLKYISYGNMQPVSTNRTSAGRQLNRRVEIHYDIHQ